MRKLIIALALLATVSSAPAFAGRLSEATGATAGHGVNVSANMSGNAGVTGSALSGIR
jgi:hypothetical protein